ncbi:hypothetical protein DP090_008155 [Pseudomonas sp. MDMC216]|jgi:multidrug transporter EmrE-like cation transporter|nr:MULTISPECIES: hypothetical protein [Pseudomonas]MBG0846831.1 hypothetical protein [Pseudomonas chengduensis]MDI5992995.1 hypothetical protein [Pseudomonas sp. MDMC216]MDI6007699.1 hypothetical protein [Pseudomonas sp. MDMC17]RAR37065.1 hypothetical protein DP092_08340 [Pseudomonas sp. MDMC224]
MTQELARPAATPSDVTRHTNNLYEVWGDTVDSRHLVLAILISAVVSLGTYALALGILADILDSAQMAKAYAMLFGILGCLGGGTISAFLFKPKRDVVEHVADPAFREQVVNDLLKEYGSLGRLEETSPEVIAELRDLGLYELFRDAQRREEGARESAADTEVDEHASLQPSGGRS